jgi:hypothetical protein
MLSWERTQGRAALYSCLGRVEVRVATYQDDSGKVSLGKTSREYCKGPPTHTSLDQSRGEEKAEGPNSDLNPRCKSRELGRTASMVQLYEVIAAQEQQARKRRRHFITYISCELCTAFERIIRQCNTMNNKLHCDCQPEHDLVLFLSKSQRSQRLRLPWESSLRLRSLQHNFVVVPMQRKRTLHPKIYPHSQLLQSQPAIALTVNKSPQKPPSPPRHFHPDQIPQSSL